MIAFFVNHHDGKQTLASLALVGAAIMIHWCYLEFEISSLENRRGKKEKSSDNEDVPIQEQKPSGSVSAYTKRDGDTEEVLFPWEPNYRPNMSKSSTPRDSKSSNSKKSDIAESLEPTASNSSRLHHNPRAAEESHYEQLDFLASMTFANGGLRSPSCPCCV